MALWCVEFSIRSEKTHQFSKRLDLIVGWFRFFLSLFRALTYGQMNTLNRNDNETNAQQVQGWLPQL